MEDMMMANSQSLEVQAKKEVSGKGEKTTPAKYYVPPSDIYETEDALTVVMEIPGVAKDDVTVMLQNDILRVEGRIDFTKYDGIEPVYTEYNVGHYARSFAVSAKIDQEQIKADLENGVLTLTLKKAKEALPRRIAVG
jgi:HSP20 family protein